LNFQENLRDVLRLSRSLFIGIEKIGIVSSSQLASEEESGCSSCWRLSRAISVVARTMDEIDLDFRCFDGMCASIDEDGGRKMGMNSMGTPHNTTNAVDLLLIALLERHYFCCVIEFRGLVSDYQSCHQSPARV
jgi:hypothetical protein